MVWTESGWAARTGSNTVSCLIHYPFYRLSTLAWKPCAESNTVGVRASSITGRRQLTQSLFRLSVYVCVCASCLHLYIFRCMQPTTCSRHQSVRMCVCVNLGLCSLDQSLEEFIFPLSMSILSGLLSYQCQTVTHISPTPRLWSAPKGRRSNAGQPQVIRGREQCHCKHS